MVELKEFARIGSQDGLVNSKKYPPEVVVNCYSLYLLYRSCPKVADATGIPETTIHRWVRDIERNEEMRERYRELVKDCNDAMLGNIEMTMQTALQQVYKKLPEASAAQAATIFGILFDKRSIMLGNAQSASTNVFIDTAGMTDDAKADLLRRALSRTEQPIPAVVEQVD